MKVTLFFALLTSGLSQFGLLQLAELAYVVTMGLAWLQGSRAITAIMDQMRAEAAERVPTAATAPQTRHVLPTLTDGGLKLQNDPQAR